MTQDEADAEARRLGGRVGLLTGSWLVGDLTEQEVRVEFAKLLGACEPLRQRAGENDEEER